MPHPKSFVDGYKLILEYESINNQVISIGIYGFHDCQTIFAGVRNISGSPCVEDITKCFQSVELVAFIQSVISWKEFDVQNLSGINQLSIQTMFGVQKSDTAAIISGKYAEIITNSIIENSKREGAGKCGYNIKVIFKK